jgi:hypothetical protein
MKITKIFYGKWENHKRNGQNTKSTNQLEKNSNKKSMFCTSKAKRRQM